MDTTTSSPQFTDDKAQHRLTHQIACAWSATRPGTQPPADWLSAAVTTLTGAAVTQHNPGEPDHVDASDLARWQDIAQQLRHLRGETRHHAHAAATRRSQLTGLQAQVRERAIDQLYSSPDLEDSLRDALTEWGLPPIDSDNDDEDTDS